jgi:cell division septation protein DedD
MTKSVKYCFLFLLGIFLADCGSGPYDLHETGIQTEEKKIEADTTKIVTKKSEDKQEVSEKPESFTFIVQIGAFMIPFNFERFYSNAKSLLGNEVYYEIRNNLFKIRIGKYDNKAEALQFLNYVKGLGYYDAFIITIKN